MATTGEVGGEGGGGGFGGGGLGEQAEAALAVLALCMAAKAVEAGQVGHCNVLSHRLWRCLQYWRHRHRDENPLTPSKVTVLDSTVTDFASSQEDPLLPDCVQTMLPSAVTTLRVPIVEPYMLYQKSMEPIFAGLQAQEAWYVKVNRCPYVRGLEVSI